MWNWYASGTSRPSLSTDRLMTCHRTSTGRTRSTSVIQRDVMALPALAAHRGVAALGEQLARGGEQLGASGLAALGPSVGLGVLAGVDDVEAGDPEKHGQAERRPVEEQLPGLRLPVALAVAQDAGKVDVGELGARQVLGVAGKAVDHGGMMGEADAWNPRGSGVTIHAAAQAVDVK